VTTEVAGDIPSEQSPSSPSEKPRRKLALAYLIGALAGGNLLNSVFRMIGGVLQARCTDNVTLGTFTNITLALNWCSYLQLGIVNGVNRELPYFFGKGDNRRAADLAATARTWTVSMGVLVGCAFAARAAWFALHGEYQLAIGWLAHSIMAVLTFYSTMYLMATYRTAQDFARLSVANVAQSAAGIVFVVFVYWFGFNGIALRMVLMLLLSAAILHRWQPIRVPWKWSFRDFRHLLVIGFPIFLVGEMGSRLWLLIDTTLVAKYLSAAGLGLYNVVGLVRDTAVIIPIAMGQVMYPRMTEYYGRDHDLIGTMRMTVRPTLLTVAAMIPLVAAGWFLARPMTAIILPGWIEAVPAMQWSLLVPLVLTFGCVNNVYNICRRQDLYAVVILLQYAVYAGLLVWLCRNGAYLEAFPQALLAGQIVYILAGYVMLFPLYWSWKKQQSKNAAGTSL
jgi:O-antigen/teichoic acid export membrane protein